MDGNWAMGSRWAMMIPASTIRMEITIAVTGRLIKNFDIKRSGQYCPVDLRSEEASWQALDRPFVRSLYPGVPRRPPDRPGSILDLSPNMTQPDRQPSQFGRRLYCPVPLKPVRTRLVIPGRRVEEPAGRLFALRSPREFWNTRRAGVRSQDLRTWRESALCRSMIRPRGQLCQSCP